VTIDPDILDLVGDLTPVENSPAADDGTLPPAFPREVTTQTLAALLGLSTNRVNVLAQQGAIRRTPRGRFRLPEAVHHYVAYIKANPNGRAVANRATDERKRLTAAQADLAELKLAETRGDLLPIEEVRSQWSQVAVDLRARLLAVAPRVASALALDRPAAARLDAEIRAALEDIADDR
jgi:phage terminase Nu1 subunit (DNA packaging protein)